MKKNIIQIFITLLIAFLYFYLVLPPINVTSISFWIFIIFVMLTYIFTNSFGQLIEFLENYGTKKYKPKKTNTAIKVMSITVPCIIMLIILINLFNSAMFNASAYASRITIDETKSFLENVEEVDFTKLPLLDKSSTQKLGDRKMGEIPELVSQFYVSDLYTQITYQNQILRVTPLEYDGFFKYLSNKEEGITGYITVDSVNGNSTLVELEQGMKYMPSAYFSEDLMRKLRFTYPTEIFGSANFEIDEEGTPYWIVPTLSHHGISIRTDVDGIVTLNAITGETKKYDMEEIPEWVDHVYPSSLIIEQVNDWGTYVNGFLNSLFGQKDVVNTTEGYNYLTIEDDVYLYTGITSVAADESNLGFILTNLRTKETSYYPSAGAEEYSAMSSAQGLVQEKGYVSSFPLLINLEGRPTYLMSLKDAAGLVKMYAFVDVEDYQIVSVTESQLGIEVAAQNYLNVLSNNENIVDTNTATKNIVVSEINEILIDGNTYLYILDNEANKYKVQAKLNEEVLAFLKVGDTLEITYSPGNINNIKTVK